MLHFEDVLGISDINYGGHLGNDAVMSIIHEARIRFLNAHNYSELDVCGAGMIQNDAVVIYNAEAFYGDIITVQLTVEDFSATGCDFIYLMTRHADNREIARAKTGITFYDYNTKKLLRVPADFKQLILTEQAADRQT